MFVIVATSRALTTTPPRPLVLADIIMLDDDLEFQVMHALSKAHGGASPVGSGVGGAPSTLGGMTLRDYAKAVRMRWAEALDMLLRDWERWLRFRQPAIGALCWGNSCIQGARIWTHGTCHSDHKIVAYVRDATPTLHYQRTRACAMACAMRARDGMRDAHTRGTADGALVQALANPTRHGRLYVLRCICVARLPARCPLY